MTVNILFRKGNQINILNKIKFFLIAKHTLYTNLLRLES
jgi:hypothetical protein